MIIEAREVWLKDGEKLILRSPRPDEAAAMIACFKQIALTSHENMNDGPEFWDTFPVEKEAEILKSFADSPDKFMVTAFQTAQSGDKKSDGMPSLQAEVPVGSLWVTPSSPNPRLKHSVSIGMGMIESYQGRGLGTQLLRTAIFEAKKQNFHRLDLTVRTPNINGIALYEKVGFRRIGLLKDIALINGTYVDEYAYDLIL